MKKRCLTGVFILLGCVWLCACNGAGTQNAEVYSTEEQIVEKQEENLPVEKSTGGIVDMEESYLGVQNFSYELFRQIMDENNPVLSPVSAHIALSMAGSGAAGDTLAEFQSVLGNDMKSAPMDMMETLPREEENVKLELANSVWIDDEIKESDDWRSILESGYKAQVYREPLEETETMDKINGWVEQKTNGLIDRMLTKPMTEEDRFVLFNALYFKAQWQKKFDPVMTQKMDFALGDGTVVETDMMRMSMEYLRYVSNDKAEGVVLPYKDENLVFLALKPTGERDVRQMFELLTWGEISAFLSQEEETLCNLRLPKFKVEFDKVLNDPLKEMGISSAFDSQMADFSLMTEEEKQLFISMVRQKAVVIVDEEGTEAAAVTMVALCDGAALIEEEPKELYFDEPFLYVIADKEKQVPLFVGIMDDPGLK